ncbi:MAG: hypothetical protein C0594_14635 [Marinilabiliales bacterium]|nr:MAG: hypothetical protein C0594_14635 [Marinilabiliales bacterium]
MQQKIQLTLLIFIFTIFSFSFNNYAQDKGFDETIDYLNLKLKGQAHFEYKRKAVKIDFYKNGNFSHSFKVDVRDLDTNNISVSYENKSMIIYCQEDYTGCVERETRTGDVSYMDKLIFNTQTDDKSFRGFENAIMHFIRLAQILDYTSDKPFE